MSEPSTDRAGRRILGAVLMATGGLLATLSGLCSVLALVTSVSALMHGQGGGEFGPNSVPGAILMVAVWGGIPFLIGAGLFWVGWRLNMGPPKPRPSKVADTFE